MDWGARRIFGGIPGHLITTLEELCLSRGQVAFRTPCQVFYLPSADALRVSTGDGDEHADVEVRPLRGEHVHPVVSNWGLRGDDLPKVTKRMRATLEAGNSFGAFRKEDGLLVAWICTMKCGAPPGIK